MPKVPTLDRQVQIKPQTTVQDPVTLRPPEEAFGGGVGTAVAGLGKSVEATGKALSDHFITLQEKADEQHDLALQNTFAVEVDKQLNDTTPDPETNKPKGFLARPLTQAAGATVQFKALAPKLREQFMAQAVGPNSRARMSQFLDAHLTNAYEKVSQHEATQTDAAFKQELEAAQKNNVINAASLRDPRSLDRAIQVAQLQVSAGLKHIGATDGEIALKNSQMIGEMTKNAVLGVLEESPGRAMKLLESAKDKIPPLYYNEIKKTVDGKVIYEKQLSAWRQVLSDPSFRTVDGQMDMGKVDAFAFKQPGTAEDKTQMASYLHARSAVEDQATKDHIAANDAAAMNELIKGWKEGKSIDQALQDATNRGRNSTDILKKQKDAIELYSGISNPFDKLLEHQDAATKLVWDEVESFTKKNFSRYGSVTVDGVKISKRDAFLVEMKRAALGKTPDQIREILKEKMKGVDTKNMHLGIDWDFFDKPRWEVDAGARAANSNAMLAVHTQYGENLVKQATAFLTSRKAPITAANIDMVIKAAKAARGGR